MNVRKHRYPNDFFSKILFIIFSDLKKKHNKCAVCQKYIMKGGLLGEVLIKY